RPDSGLLMPPPLMRAESHNRISASPSMLSVNSIVGEKTDFKLQKVDPFFTDSSGEFARAFEKKLDGLDGRNSETSACIEEFLVKSEKQWFVTFRNVKLGRHNVHSRQPSVYAPQESRPTSSYESNSDHGSGERDSNSMNDEFLLGRDYKPPTGLRNWMQLRIGDWPVYAFFMGFGQIIAANSYQITLLTGEVGQTADKLYSIAS
ncbi:Cell wall alpha-1,3-glucan synthase ags1, partial [Exophiala xenobiotica]